MNTQLEHNTEISRYLLKERISDNDVANYLAEINKDPKIAEIESNLRSGDNLTANQKALLIEILKNVNKLFRIQGKKSPGLERYISAL